MGKTIREPQEEHGGAVNVLALCAGVGGLDLGVNLANPAARCVCYVEGESYVASILVKRMAEQALDEAPVWSDVRTFDGNPWRGKVDCITGGYPCQPFSKAGRQRGEQDPRHLWPEIRRIVEEVQPSRCFFENVANHLRLGFEQVHDDLQQMGFQVAAGLFTAEEVGAGHERDRLYIMAVTNSGSARCGRSQATGQAWQPAEFSDGQTVSERCASKCWSASTSHLVHEMALFPPSPDAHEAWDKIIRNRPDLEPGLDRMADGLADRMDRYRACGNAVVPLVAAYAWRVLETDLAIRSCLDAPASETASAPATCM